MTNMQKVEWYGGDGATKAFDFLTKKSYGNQYVKQEEEKAEVKAQNVIDKRPKRKPGHQKVTPALRVSKHLDSDVAASTSSAYPPSQLGLTQKRPRALSSVVTKDAPRHKRSKYDDTLSSESMDNPQPKSTNRDKGKDKELTSDRDEEMTTDPPNSNDSEGIVLVPDTDEDHDVVMSTEPPPAGSCRNSMTPPP